MVLEEKLALLQEQEILTYPGGTLLEAAIVQTHRRVFMKRAKQLGFGVAVAAAFEDFCRRLGVGPALVQAQVGPGVELAIGARRDPNFGPVVIAGLGGVWIEALKDMALRLAPVTTGEALAMLGDLKGKNILSGFRGQAAVSVSRFAQLIADVSQWFAAAAWLGELDLNPVIAVGDDFTIVDVRMRVANRSISS
jgi:ATP-grasp domain/(2R)-phospho-3-sulfolactate synthase (ComA)